MCPTPNGDGLELEKSNYDNSQPPSISITAPADVIDAGLKSLDHCKYSGYEVTPARNSPLLYSLSYY